MPFGLFPDSVQTDAPVAQLVAPILHALVSVQAVPEVQLAHAPLVHTMFVPQRMPFA